MKKKILDTGQSRPNPGPDEKKNGDQEGQATGSDNLENMIIDHPQDLPVSETKDGEEKSKEAIIDSGHFSVSTEGAAEPSLKEPITEQPAGDKRGQLALIEVKGSGYENLTTKLLFRKFPGKGGQDSKTVYETPLWEVGEFLRGTGIPSVHLNEGELAVAGFSSGRLGYAMHIVFTEDEGAMGAGLLNVCRDLSPSEGIIDFLDIPDVSQYPLKGKTIFLPHSPTKDKRLKALSLLLNNNRVFFQDLPKGSRQTGLGNEIEGPVGLVAFVKDASSDILELPFAIRFHIPLPTGLAAERTIAEEKGFRPNSPEYRVARNYRKAVLAHLSRRRWKFLL